MPPTTRYRRDTGCKPTARHRAHTNDGGTPSLHLRHQRRDAVATPNGEDAVATPNGEDAVATSNGGDAVVTSIDVRLRVYLRIFFEAVIPRIADGQRLAALNDRFRRIDAGDRHPQAVAQ